MDKIKQFFKSISESFKKFIEKFESVPPIKITKELVEPEVIILNPILEKSEYITPTEPANQDLIEKIEKQPSNGNHKIKISKNRIIKPAKKTNKPKKLIKKRKKK